MGVPYVAGKVGACMRVRARHTDDAAMLGTKHFTWPFTLDIIFKQVVVGTRGIGAMYKRQLRAIRHMSEQVGEHGCPTLIGEFGIPYAAARRPPRSLSHAHIQDFIARACA
jgi:hypothetical protein